MSEKFTPEEINKLRDIHQNDETAESVDDGVMRPFDDLSMAVAGLQATLEKPEAEIDRDDFREKAKMTVSSIKEVDNYLDKYTENHIVQIDINREEVLDLRTQMIEALKEKGTEDATIIGTGWRKTLYGKTFQDTLLARGVEIWYPGITRPTETAVIDTPVHITVIEGVGVEHEPRRISLSSRGEATTSTTIDSNLPDTKAWYEVLRDTTPDEWKAVIGTTLEALESAA